MSFEFWVFYATTVFVASIIPGPSMLLALTHGIKYDLRGTVATAMGNVTASVLQALVSIAGLGAILTVSGTIFGAIKWLGAAYLIYTGIRNLKSPASDFSVSKINRETVSTPWHKRFRQAFFVAAGNPKAMIFFSALFPQFINTKGAQLPQYAAMVATLALIAFVCFMIYAQGGEKITALFRKRQAGKWVKRMIGGTFIGVGIGVAASEP